MSTVDGLAGRAGAADGPAVPAGGYVVAIAGATGVVGSTVRSILEERSFPVGELRLLASERSVGRRLAFRGEQVPVELLTADSFAGVDLAFFAAGGAVSTRLAPAAVTAGATVIDKSSVFRQDPHVPLVVPEVNRDALDAHRGLIATPNCSTIQMVVALKPIYDAAGIERVVVSTYQAVSGSGQRGVDELLRQAPAVLAGEPAEASFYPRQIAFNLLPHIDSFLASGYTKEEQKMVDETMKIFADPELKVSATCVRVPVITAHSEAINVQTRRPLSAGEARELLAAAPGVKVIDDPASLLYPTPAEAAGTDAVYVGRIRADETIANGLNFWCVSDNLRKGAALNAVQIAEELVRRGALRPAHV
jgi:aspartate-semialdehyde dehydrogenase